MIDYFITGLVILLSGLALLFYPPKKKINKYGYRSKASMESQENWELAQRLSGQYLILNGIISLGLSVVLMHYWPGDNSRLIAVIFPILGVLLMVRVVEGKLRS